MNDSDDDEMHTNARMSNSSSDDDLPHTNNSSISSQINNDFHSGPIYKDTKLSFSSNISSLKEICRFIPLRITVGHFVCFRLLSHH